MNDYVVPKEVIEWAKEQLYANRLGSGLYNLGYVEALQDFLDKINVVYTKDTEQ